MSDLCRFCRQDLEARDRMRVAKAVMKEWTS